MLATARIAEELNNQYVLGYSSPKSTDGKFHSIRVSMRDPAHAGPRPERLRRHADLEASLNFQPDSLEVAGGGGPSGPARRGLKTPPYI